MNWIKVKDKLPKRGQLVLFAYNKKGTHPDDVWVLCGYCNTSNHWYNQFEDRHNSVECYPTHWMPLPEPPTK